METFDETRAALAAQVRGHIANERAMLEAYATVATSEDYVRYLIGLLLEEEMRHHRYFSEIANGLEGAPWAQGVPDVTPEDDPDLLLAQTAALVDFERHDLAELKDLQRALTEIEGSELMRLLVELMQMDTRKHIKILRFIGARARAARKDQRSRARTEATAMVDADPLVSHLLPR